MSAPADGACAPEDALHSSSPSDSPPSDMALDNYFTFKALFETTKKSSAEKIKHMENEVLNVNNKYEDCKTKLDDSEKRIHKLEKELEMVHSDLKSTSELLLIQKVNAENCKLQRDSALEVRNSLSNMIETRNMEIECLKITIEGLHSQLEIAVNTKCDTLTKNSVLDCEALSNNIKEKYLCNENGQKEQIDALKNELYKCKSDLCNMKTDNVNMKMSFERDLTNKADELNIANAKICRLGEIKESLYKKIESMNEIIAQQEEKEQKIHEDYKNELITKTKIAELYKSIQEDSNKKIEQLTNSITELKQLLGESNSKCEDLENKLKNIKVDHKKRIVEKDERILDLKRELENANDLLQMSDTDGLNITMEDLSPSANLASKLIKSKMSITQAYNMLVKLSTDLDTEKNENKRLSHALASIVSELEEKAPLIEQQKVEYAEAMENNEYLRQEIDSLIQKTNEMKDERADLERNYKCLQKENNKHKIEIKDLTSQISFLLKTIETKREIKYNSYNISESETFSFDNSTQSATDVINKNLVTFTDINELIENNQKLLKIVRELSEKKEENELSDEMNSKEFQNKLQTLENRITELTSAQDRQVKMINKLVQQRDKYKKMCNETSMIKENSSFLNKTLDSIDLNNSDKSELAKIMDKNGQYLELIETQLNDTKSELGFEREKYKQFVEKSKQNELRLIESNDVIYKQFTELQFKYNRCLSSSENINEKVKILQMELETYKKEISSLNQKINAYTSLTGKQESSIKKIFDDLSCSRNKLSNAESLINNLQADYDSEKNKSKNTLNVLNEHQEHCSLTLKNIELIKNTMLENDINSVSKLESSLEEVNQTCTTLRCMLQEEQDKYNNLTAHFYQEIEQYKLKIENKESQINNLKEELLQAQDDICKKSVLIDNLNKKILYNSQEDGADNITDSLRINKYNANEYEAQLNTLRNQLEISKNHVEKYCNIYECAERELLTITSNFNNYKKTTEVKLREAEESESKLQEKCSKLEEEILLRSNELSEFQNKTYILSAELEEKNTTLNKAVVDIDNLSKNIHLAEEKYANEIESHSNDILALSELKNKLSIANKNNTEIAKAKSEIECIFKENKLTWENKEKMLLIENEDIKKQISDLVNQNTMLHDEIQALKHTLVNMKQTTTSSEVGNIDNSINYQINENDLKSSEQLVDIVRYLRREKEVLVTKFDIMQTENQRIKTQLETAEAQLDEMKLALLSNKEKTDSPSIKHSGVIRKIEELNAISDCYTNIRKERDELQLKIEDVVKDYKKLQENSLPLQQLNCELTTKLTVLESENINFKSEIDKWKNRVNLLLGENGQHHPDDWKKMQNERESLLKSLSDEKENVKGMANEINKLKKDYSQMEEQNEKLRRQNLIINDNLKKKLNELNVLKKETERINQELSQSKIVINDKNVENNTLNEKLTANEISLSEIRDKELQIRKIAKRYKIQYDELLKTLDEEKKKSASLVSKANATSENHLEAYTKLEQKTIELEKSHSDKISEFNKQIITHEESNKSLQMEIEKGKQLLKNAKARLHSLTEMKENLMKELTELKNKIDVFEQNKDESDVRLQALKSQFDGRVAKLEKEKTQLLNEKQLEIAQLNKQIESLLLKINQLQKKLDNQQNPKPSTSSISGEKSALEPPTANIKPMAGVTSGRDSRRVIGETPLASIRPMASHSGIRTAAVLPTTAQPTSHAITHHQAPHTTGTILNDTTSSPSSSHHIMEYMPSSSSIGPRTHTPLSRHATVFHPESTQQDIDLETTAENDMTTALASTNPQQPVGLSQHGLQQGVALVMPRVETINELQTSHSHQQACSSSNNNSSSSVTTTHAGNNSSGVVSSKSDGHRSFKRPRMTAMPPQQKIILKRPKIQVTESEAEYQVPTSSQKDQEDDMNFPDSEDDETYQDPMYEVEEENDEIEEDKSQIRKESMNIEEPCISNTQETSRSNEADFTDNLQDNQNRNDEGENRGINDSRVDDRETSSSVLCTPLQEQQISAISTISSANSLDSGFLVISGTNSTGVTSALVGGTYEEGDDSIVPSTPTLYVPARNDGFGEAIRSPMTRNIQTNEGRFTFNEGNSGGVMDDTLPDLAPQLAPSHLVSTDTTISVQIDENMIRAVDTENELGESSGHNSNVEDESLTVTSQGTSNILPQVQIEEGCEAEASSTANSNISPRVTWPENRGGKSPRRGNSTHVHTPRPTEHQRSSLIVWNNPHFRRGSFLPQRGLQRGNRHNVRRPPFFKRF